MRILDNQAVLSLLRAEVKRAGGPLVWSRKTGIHRATVSKALHGRVAITKGILKALGLRITIVSEND
jgi:hypothetical protein